jgi:hypothetical protein
MGAAHRLSRRLAYVAAVTLALLAVWTPAAIPQTSPSDLSATASAPADATTLARTTARHTTPPATDVAAVCARAEALNAQGRPADALTLIDDLRGGDVTNTERLRRPDSPDATCHAERNEALRRISLGSDLAAAAAVTKEIARLREELPATEAASAADADVRSRLAEATQQKARLMTVPSGDGVAGTCSIPTGAVDELDAQVLKEAALACDTDSVPGPDEPAPWSKGVATRWKDFSTKHLDPLAEPVAGVLGILATGSVVGLILTRPVGLFLTRRVRSDDPGGARRTPPVRPRDRLAVLAVGIAILALAAARVMIPTTPVFWVVVLTALVLGAVLFAMGAADGVPAVMVAVALMGIAITAAVNLPTSAMLGLLVVAVAAGGGLIGWAMSQSLRMSIRVTDAEGKDDPNASAHVAALIRELTAGDLQGLETPSPAGETPLGQAGLTTTPEGRVAKAAYLLLQLLLPSTPWVIRIHVESADVHAVSVSQHGRLVRADVVERDPLGLRIPVLDAAKQQVAVGKDKAPLLPDMHRLCAAVVVAAFAERYEMPGLVGASTWQGIGLHFVAKTDLEHNTREQRVDVLARGVAADPGNCAVLLEFWHAKYRLSTDEAELALYSEALRLYADTARQHAERYKDSRHGQMRAPHRLLQLQAQYSRFAALVNRFYLLKALDERNADEEEEARTAITTAVDHLEATTDVIRGAGTTTTWISTMERRLSAAQRLSVLLDGSAPGRSDPQLSPPVVAYDWACFLASDEQWPRAVTQLRAAEGVARLDEWRSKDPQLKWLREQPEYLAVFGRKPLSAFLDLTVLAPHKEALERVGAQSAAATLSFSREELAALLRTSLGQSESVRRVAALVLSVPTTLEAWQTEIVEHLTQQGTFWLPNAQTGLASKLAQKMARCTERAPGRSRSARSRGRR